MKYLDFRGFVFQAFEMFIIFNSIKIAINFVFIQVEKGVPALLVYKNKDLIGNYVRLREEFGDDFFAGDVESFLQE